MTHVSFSELKIWNDCPFKHKLTYIDGIKGFKGNEYTAFGTAIHDVCENVILHPELEAQSRMYFDLQFMTQLKLLEEQNISLNQKMIGEMKQQGPELSVLVLPAVRDHFEEYEVISTEEKIYEDIEGFENQYKFKGYIDLVLKTSDGKYHIIDWKSCSWGWNVKRKFDPMTTYQLTFYKHYFANKHNIDPSNIETHFALLKRTAKKNKVEIFRVTSGAKKTQNALNLLTKSLHNIARKNFIKNRLSCNRCEFKKTKYCP